MFVSWPVACRAGDHACDEAMGGWQAVGQPPSLSAQSAPCLWLGATDRPCPPREICVAGRRSGAAEPAPDPVGSLSMCVCMHGNIYQGGILLGRLSDARLPKPVPGIDLHVLEEPEPLKIKPHLCLFVPKFRVIAVMHDGHDDGGIPYMMYVRTSHNSIQAVRDGTFGLWHMRSRVRACWFVQRPRRRTNGLTSGETEVPLLDLSRPRSPTLLRCTAASPLILCGQSMSESWAFGLSICSVVAVSGKRRAHKVAWDGLNRVRRRDIPSQA